MPKKIQLRIRIAALVAHIVVIAVRMPAFTVDSKQVEESLKSKYMGRLLTLRNFYTANWLRYTGAGTLIGPEETGTWTLYSTVEVKKIALANDTLHIEGRRRALLYDAKKGAFGQARTDLPIRIDLEYPPGAADERAVEETMTKVFITPKENLLDLLPHFWQSFLQKQRAAKDQNTKQKCSEPPGVLHIGKTVSAPKVLSKVDPVYTEVASKGGVQGTVILCVVVQHDGTIGNGELFQPLGLGLDESAVEAVKLWRFQPAIKEGNPVDVLATIEVTFRLLPR